MNLAIMPLIQVATLPRLMMRTPERLTLTLPRSMSVRHFVLSICKSRERTDRDPDTRRKCARNGRLPFGRDNSPKNRGRTAPLIEPRRVPVPDEKLPVSFVKLPCYVGQGI